MMQNKTPNPLVSIVIATYNRSNVLGYSIQSVLNSDFQDWELLVIGDCCTDDTENVVLLFADKRIKFINLEKNYGEQSQANNAGLKLSKGKYIAFLNHDDLWFPDHLTTAIRCIEETGADLVYSLVGAMYEVKGKPNLLFNYYANYNPQTDVPASSWFFKRALYEAVGEWNYYKNCSKHPSQDWIYRAWKGKYKLSSTGKLTVIAIPSGRRKNVYLNREWKENEYYFNQIKNNPNFREKVLTDFVIQYIIESKRVTLFKVVKFVFKPLFLTLGIEPRAIRKFVTLVYRGEKKDIDYLRKVRGLPPIK